ncbi:hypothetical protein [Acidovorax sp. A79]|uniref:hypothetical protein n=1 Tax=Acidovorax sp. A79 TaxID=3056107 RepID=UPI0034E8E9BF
MATNKSPAREFVADEEDAVTDSAQLPIPTPRWTFWRQSGTCRLWQAVVLTLNVEPPSKSRQLREMLSAEQHQEFRDRKLIAIRQYGVHPLLPSREHHATGSRIAEKYVSLLDMLAFGQVQGWTDIHHMAAGLTDRPANQLILPTAGGSVVHKLEPEKIPKGERYTLARMGALIEVIEQWIATDGRIPESCIRAGKLNFSALERLAEVVIAEKARANGLLSYSGFNEGVIRKEYSEAKKMLEEYFRQ